MCNIGPPLTVWEILTSVPGLDVSREGAILPLLVPLLYPSIGADGPAAHTHTPSVKK